MSTATLLNFDPCVVSDPGSAERMVQKRKMPSPCHSSNGHSSAEASPSPTKRKKKPGAVSNNKDQVNSLTHSLPNSSFPSLYLTGAACQTRVFGHFYIKNAKQCMRYDPYYYSLLRADRQWYHFAVVWS